MKGYQDNSLSGKVFQQLRDDILNGKYKENDELREITIGKELGVSRTPVREALRQLELEGLIQIIPNKGAYVHGITTKDVNDIYRMRSLLEGLCARWATENISEEQMQQLEEVMLLSEYHLGQEKSDQVVLLDGKFHEILYQASNSRMLEHLLGDFHRYVRMARRKSVEQKGRADLSVKEHRAILDAIKDKNADKAEELANNHIKKVVENLRQQNYEQE